MVCAPDFGEIDMVNWLVEHLMFTLHAPISVSGENLSETLAEVIEHWIMSPIEARPVKSRVEEFSSSCSIEFMNHR